MTVLVTVSPPGHNTQYPPRKGEVYVDSRFPWGSVHGRLPPWRETAQGRDMAKESYSMHSTQETERREDTNTPFQIMPQQLPSSDHVSERHSEASKLTDGLIQ